MAEIENDQSLFERVWYANRDNRLLIGIDLRHFNRPGSPTYSRSDNALPMIATACCVLTAWMLGGWVWALAILASGVILTLTTAQIWVMHRLRQRTLALVLGSLQDWLTVWRYGGIDLRLVRDGGESGPTPGAAAPDDDWRAFVRRHLPEVRD